MAEKSSLDDLKIDRSGVSDSPSGSWMWVLLLLPLAVIAGLTYWLMQPEGKTVVVVVARVTSLEGGQTVLNASGYVTARRMAVVSSKVTAKVLEVLIDEGMEVRKGQVLARLDASNVERSLRLAEAQLASAKSVLAETKALLAEAKLRLGRTKALVKDEVLSQAQLDAVQAETGSLEARLARQGEDEAVAERRLGVWQQQLDDTVIRAPFSGIVTTKDAQPGEMISPVSAGGGFTRTGIGTVVDMASLEIEVDVNESYINRVRAGQEVEAALDAYPDWKIPCHVIAIVPTADRDRATVRVRIGFEELESRILPDMGVKVAFRGEQVEQVGRRVVLIPKDAVRKDDGRDVVFVLTGDKVERRAVTLSVSEGEDAIVTAGIEGGESVVVKGPPDLEDGDQVEVTSFMSVNVNGTLVKVDEATKYFKRGSEEIHVLEKLDMQVPEGEFLALMGPSGSGKSTLLNLIGGLDRPTSGSVTVGGERIDRLSRQKLAAWRARHVGLVFQFYNLLPVLTAERNVELPLLLTHLSRAQRKKHVDAALDVVGLSHRKTHYPRTLSGGEQQRVGIARGIVSDPTLLLADEPTGDLDRKSGDEVLDLLQALNKDHNKTIIMVTHDPHAAMRSTRTLYLNEGKLSTERVE